MNISMIKQTREIEQTLQSVISVRVSSYHAYSYFYTRKRRRNSQDSVLIGGSGTKQYLICLGQSSPLHFATEGAFTNQ